MKKIRVLFFIPNLAHGGAERVLVNLVNHMNSEKFDITLQTMFDVGIYKDKLNKEIEYLGGFPWYFRGNTLVYKLFPPRLLYKFYIKGDYDVVVSYLEGPSARVIGGAPGNQKTVCWIHIQLDTKDYAGQVFRNIDEFNTVYRSFNKIVCVSDTVRQSFNKIINVTVPIEVLYNTVETDVIRKKSSEVVEDIAFRKEEINIVSVAKLMKTKGYDRLVHVLKRIRNEGIPAHVYIVGKGEEESSIQKLISENGLDEAWTFIGFRENPYKYVRMADLYVCSSRVEGFSTAVTESLIVGTPVVSTNCSGAQELLGYQNEYGIVTDNDEDALYEGIKEILTAPGLLEHYKKQASIRGNKFNTEETVRAVEKMLEEVVAE